MTARMAHNVPINTSQPEVALYWYSTRPTLGSDVSSEMERLAIESFLESDVLPLKMSPNALRHLVNHGTRFRGPVPDDELFMLVDLPEGWTKRSTSTAYVFELVDAKGDVVAWIFYCAVPDMRYAALYE